MQTSEIHRAYHDLGGDTLLGQEHLTHLHGLLVMGGIIIWANMMSASL